MGQKNPLGQKSSGKKTDAGEIIRYLIMGGATTLVSWGSYALFAKTIGWTILASNILSWICAVLFAYLTNKVWVFRSYSWKIETVLKEAALFFSARLATGVIEMAGVPLLVKLGLSQKIMGIKGMAAKVLVSVIVVILNYVFSKLFVFRDEQN